MAPPTVEVMDADLRELKRLISSGNLRDNTKNLLSDEAVRLERMIEKERERDQTATAVKEKRVEKGEENPNPDGQGEGGRSEGHASVDHKVGSDEASLVSREVAVFNCRLCPAQVFTDVHFFP